MWHKPKPENGCNHAQLHGPVAQRQSRGLLILVSWVRIPAGSPPFHAQDGLREPIGGAPRGRLTATAVIRGGRDGSVRMVWAAASLDPFSRSARGASPPRLAFAHRRTARVPWRRTRPIGRCRLVRGATRLCDLIACPSVRSSGAQGRRPSPRRPSWRPPMGPTSRAPCVEAQAFVGERRERRVILPLVPRFCHHQSLV